MQGKAGIIQNHKDSKELNNNFFQLVIPDTTAFLFDSVMHMKFFFAFLRTIFEGVLFLQNLRIESTNFFQSRGHSCFLQQLQLCLMPNSTVWLTKSKVFGCLTLL